MEATGVIKNSLMYIFATLVVIWTVQAVPPPTNVTLLCHNFLNFLYWNYSQPSLQPRFRIDVGAIKGHQGPLWVDSPHLHGDISSFADPTNDYYVTVTAVVGQNESDAAPDQGITFSYFKDSPSDLKCFVDFPPVNVTVQSDDIVEVRFLHPCLFYNHKPAKQKRRQKKHELTQLTTKLSKFAYVVETQHQNTHRQHPYSCTESVCEQRLAVEAGQERPCVRVHGEWEQVAVRSTKEYCASALPVNKITSYTPVYIVVPLLLAFAIGLIFFMVYRKQTRSSPAIPASMTFPQIKHKIMRSAPLTPEEPATSPVDDSSPTVTVLLPTTEGEEWLYGGTPVEPDLRLPIGVLIQDGSQSGGMAQPAEDAEGPLYTSGRGLDGDVEERGRRSGDYGRSGYEARDKLVTDEIAPGDKVEGYRG